MPSVIEIKNLTKTYPLPKKQGFFEALKGISFSVEKGEIFGLLGPNGAGKTTTLEILECLKKPTSGEITVLGHNINSQADEIKNKIGVQLQSSGFLPGLSLEELLTLFSSLYPKNSKKSPAELLEMVGLKGKLKEEFKNLSGGQKQRFTIAVSLVNSPEIIFLDEPTTGLDPQARRNLWQLVKDINQKGITVVLTTHYMEEAEFLCHRVGVLDEGKILAIERPAKLIEDLSHTTQISFFADRPLKEENFKALGVEKIISHPPKIILEITSLDSVSPIVRKLKEDNIPFFGLTVKTASLEDVYLDLTGKEYLEN